MIIYIKHCYTYLLLNFEVILLKNEGLWPAIDESGCCETPPPPPPYVGIVGMGFLRSAPWNVFLACIPRVKLPGLVPGEMVGALWPGAVLSIV